MILIHQEYKYLKNWYFYLFFEFFWNFSGRFLEIKIIKNDILIKKINLKGK